MAIDNFYRLVIHGPLSNLSAFRRGVAQWVNRPAVGPIDGWREFIPISIDAIRRRYPNVRRVTDPALDSYYVRAWPRRRVGSNRGVLRYQFQTRNSEFIDYLVPLSRRFPPLVFVLVALSLDGDAIESYLVKRGRFRRWLFPAHRREWHWNQARAKFGFTGDEVYDDDEAESFAEEGMLAEAL